jgi:ABC-2 type transport system permease protein
MRTFAALLLKEEKAIFTSPIAYVVLSVFLVIMGYTFTLTLFVSHVPTLVHLFFQIYVLFLLTVPIITMRLVAEERRLRTIEMLLSAPVSEPAVVFAKYLASLSLVVLMLVLSGAYAITLGVVGQPDWGPIYSGYLGLFLLGAALVAVGLMTSSLVSNQIIPALLSLSLFLLLWIIDHFGWMLPDPFDALVVNLSLLVHFTPFATGSILDELAVKHAALTAVLGAIVEKYPVDLDRVDAWCRAIAAQSDRERGVGQTATQRAAHDLLRGIIEDPKGSA